MLPRSLMPKAVSAGAPGGSGGASGERGGASDTNRAGASVGVHEFEAASHGSEDAAARGEIQESVGRQSDRHPAQGVIVQLIPEIAITIPSERAEHDEVATYHEASKCTPRAAWQSRIACASEHARLRVPRDEEGVRGRWPAAGVESLIERVEHHHIVVVRQAPLRWRRSVAHEIETSAMAQEQPLASSRQRLCKDAALGIRDEVYCIASGVDMVPVADHIAIAKESFDTGRTGPVDGDFVRQCSTAARGNPTSTGKDHRPAVGETAVCEISKGKAVRRNRPALNDEMRPIRIGTDETLVTRGGSRHRRESAIGRKTMQIRIPGQSPLPDNSATWTGVATDQCRIQCAGRPRQGLPACGAVYGLHSKRKGARIVECEVAGRRRVRAERSAVAAKPHDLWGATCRIPDDTLPLIERPIGLLA